VFVAGRMRRGRAGGTKRHEPLTMVEAWVQASEELLEGRTNKLGNGHFHSVLSAAKLQHSIPRALACMHRV
jgi:hypothetical protein